jgi:hypothetical protein
MISVLFFILFISAALCLIMAAIMIVWEIALHLVETLKVSWGARIWFAVIAIPTIIAIVNALTH